MQQYRGDLLSDVRQVSRTARVFGVGSPENAVRKVALRALEVEDDETRQLAMQILCELDRLPKFARGRG